MKIIITGASGFVGKELIPLLSDHELVLAGRTTSNLTYASEFCTVCNYDDLRVSGQGAHIFVNLAVVNNYSNAAGQSFFEINRDFAAVLFQLSKDLGVSRYINVSTVHVLDDTNQNVYASSKRSAVKLLKNLPGNAETVYLAHVYGRRFSGRLSILNALPTPLAKLVFYTYSAFKPTTNVEALAQYVLTSKAENVIPIDSGEVAIVDSKNKNRCFRVAKRAIDLAFVLVVIGLFWWLLILLWVAIRSQSGGSPIFRQLRLGLNEVPFVCYKFRTMKLGTAEVGTHEVAATALTPIGIFLRRTKLDELPQILNILKNEMTLFGPRPCLRGQTELIEERRRRKVFSSIPGISGLAQINKIDMTSPKLLASWDAKYLANQGINLDLRMFVKTLQMVLNLLGRNNNV
jgi:lipopolysaccharide/colanic/teichoic acid biosynthesis glycosyltransferase